jgi:hypothetical protein
MPNWSYNTTEITGDSDEIARFRNAIEPTRDTDTFATDEGYSLLRTFIPRPQSVVDDGTWYEWGLTHWGTKWEDDNRLKTSESNRLLFVGQTAWAPPIDGYITVSTMFPTLTFTLGYMEESDAFFGAMTFRNGEVVAKREVTYKSAEMPVWDEADPEPYRNTIDFLYDQCWNQVAVTVKG